VLIRTVDNSVCVSAVRRPSTKQKAEDIPVRLNLRRRESGIQCCSLGLCRMARFIMQRGIRIVRGTR
jgi:hypothetical protein